jgi:alpha-L-fucosidase
VNFLKQKLANNLLVSLKASYFKVPSLLLTLQDVRYMTKKSSYLIIVIFILVIGAVTIKPAPATDLSVLKQNYVDQDYGLFMHYSMGTYTNEEWAHSLPMSSINTFNPTAGLVNTDQWAATAVAAGMKYGVLTTKHHDGFALWNTAQSTYDVASTSWYNTYHQDIVGSYVNSFRNAGLGVGLYYSFWDKYNGIGPKNYTDDYSIGLKSSAAATNYIKAEINDLLTNYGHIDVLWVDGWGWADQTRGCTYSYVNYQDVYNYIKSVSPDTLLVNNVNEGTTAHTDIVGYETQFSGSLPQPGNTVPSEGNATLRSDNGWFYHDSGANSLKSADWVADQIVNLNARNTTYLLDVPQNKAGVIPATSVTRLQEIKTLVDNTPAPRPGNLAIGKTATESSNWSSRYPAGNAVNGFKSDYAHTATEDTNPWWMVDLGSTTSIGEVDLHNRMDGYDGRLRDITVEILNASNTVIYTSELLNPDNILGGGVNDYTNGPDMLTLLVNHGVPVMGRYVRIRRTIETSGVGNTDDRLCLTLSDVDIFAVPEPSTIALLVMGGLILLLPLCKRFKFHK